MIRAVVACDGELHADRCRQATPVGPVVTGGEPWTDQLARLELRQHDRRAELSREHDRQAAERRREQLAAGRWTDAGAGLQVRLS